MAQLRQKLEENPSQPKHLMTELQVGYRLSGLTVEADAVPKGSASVVARAPGDIVAGARRGERAAVS